MKYFILFILCLHSFLTFACSCEEPVYYCDYSKQIAASENGVILIGEYLTVDTIDEFTWAYQFKVLDVIRGEVAVGGMLDNDPKYVNTDSTIWLKGGMSSLCYYSHLSGRVLISAVAIDNGYYPYTCVPGCLDIDEDDVIQGGPWEFDFRLSLDDLEGFILGTCTSGTEDARNHLDEVTSIFPNPTTDNLVVEKSHSGHQVLNYTLFDIIGNSRCTGILEEKRKVISLAELPDGIYFLTLELDGVYYTEKITKAAH